MSTESKIRILELKQYDGYVGSLKSPSIKMRLSFSEHSSKTIIDKKNLIEIFGLDEKILARIEKDTEASLLVNLSFEIFKSLRVPVGAEYSIEMIGDNECIIFFPYIYKLESIQILLLTIHFLNNYKFSNTQELKNRFDVLATQLRSKIDKTVNNFYLLSAAERLKMPIFQVDQSTWQIGLGKNLKCFNSTLSDTTPALAVFLAADKFLTANYLNSRGYPGSNHILVNSIDQLKNAVSSIGYPIVIKPADREKGEGVSANLICLEDCFAAYRLAAKYSKRILVEKYQDGFTYRVTTINSKIVKVVKRIAGGVFGNGYSSVQELIYALHKDNEYIARCRQKGRHLIDLDEEALSLLKQNNLDVTYVPKSQEYIRLRRRDNRNAGGTNEVIDINGLHKDNCDLCINLSKQLNFDILGIDIIIPDIKNSWLESGATICEINAKPQLGSRNDQALYENMLLGEIKNNGLVKINIFIYENNSSHLSNKNLFDKYSNLAKYSSSYLGVMRHGKFITTSFKNSFLAARCSLMRKDIDELLIFMSTGDLEEYGLPVYSEIFANVYASTSLCVEQVFFNKLNIEKKEVIFCD